MRQPAKLPIAKIISGGQTGVDRAALDAALALGIPCGGWCPKGRRAEDGVIPEHYPLTETTSKDYRVRTRRNVRDSDGTLILSRGPVSGGTALTRRLAKKMNKPCLVVDLAQRPRASDVRAWIPSNNTHTLNVAGPRESSQPGIHALARRFLQRVLGRG
jgi:predicted Rossmann fold nucleotide-binding protein DprA/Smf involved in DNA uptake